MSTKEEDFVEDLFIASTHSYIMVFTDRGRCYWLKVHEVPDAGPAARGKAIVNLIAFQPGEKIASILPVTGFDPDKFILMCTRRGTIKKTGLDEYSNPRASGIIAIKIDPEDSLLCAKLTGGSHDILIATADGMAIRFNEKDVRPMGRVAAGVRGIRLSEGDSVIGMEACDKGAAILTVSERGYGKRTVLEQYRLIRRGGRGVITMRTTEKTGRAVGILPVTEQNDVMLITDRGKLIRCGAEEIRVAGRNTQGVRLIRLEEGEKVVATAKLAERDENGGEAAEGQEQEGKGP
jgi:DNA gyrase subunit A